MGCCCGRQEDEYEPEPRRGGERLGDNSGVSVNREEARERAAAAAEERAKKAQARGQQGEKSKMKPSPALAPPNDRTRELNDPRVWD